jgi:hypothetical protein
MERFIKRMKDAWNNLEAYDREPLFFKVFMFFAICVGLLCKLAYCIVIFFTVPLWIVPYVIYWCKKGYKR